MNNKLQPFKFYCQKVIPLVFDDSLSYYETLCKFVECLNKVIEQTNIQTENIEELTRLYSELKLYVDTYFNNLDVQKEINIKLDEMVIDGTLAKIINKEIFNELNEKIDNLENELNERIDKIENESKNFNPVINRINRILIKSGLNDFENSENYSFIQGYAKLNDMVLMTLISIQGDYKYNNKARVIKYNLQNNVIVNDVVLDLGHANSLTINPVKNEIYIPETFRYNDNHDSYYTNKINVLNLDNLAIKTSYDIDGLNGIASVSYDNITEKLYCASINHVHELSSAFTIVKTIQLSPYNINEYTMQTINVYNNKIYKLIYNPNALIIHNIDGTVESQYSFNKESNDGFYLGEFEDLCIEEDNISIASGCFSSGGTQKIMNQIFNINLNVNNISNQVDTNYVNGFRNFYVNNNVTSVNPDGSEDNPFNEVFEVIPFLSNNKTLKNVFIKNSENAYSFLQINNCSNAEFNFENGCKINGIISNRTNNTLIRNVEILNNKDTDVPLKIDFSILRLDNLKFSNDHNYNYCINCTNSEIYIFGNFINNNENANDLLLNYGSKLNTILNLKFNTSSPSVYLNPDKRIIASNINSGEDDYVIELDSHIDKNINELKQMFNYINFVISYSGGLVKQFKYPLNLTNYQINTMNLGDSNVSVVIASEMIVQTNNTTNKLYIRFNHAINLNGFSETKSDLILKSIYLSNN